MKSVIRKKNYFKKSYFMLNKERIANVIRIPNEFNIGNVQSMAIPNYNEHDVALVINYLNNSSSGWDNIPALIAKQVIHCYIKHCIFLINQSLIEGVFPDELKLAYSCL